MLSVQDIHVAYGGINALRGISIEVDKNEIVAVLGANGAGKSTLLKSISGMLKLSGGCVQFEGEKITASPYKIAGKGIAHVPEGRQIIPDLTVMENLRLGAFLRKDKDGIERDMERCFKLFPRLKERITQFGGLLSGGEQQMLAISRGIMSNPKLMMLDEPSLGLAPIVVNQIFEIIKEIRDFGTSILIVEQNAHKALKICDRAYILSVGEIARQGSRDELLNDKDLAKEYL